MHLKRWLTGIVAIPILIAIIGFAPRWIFHILLLFASIKGLMEFYEITASPIPRFVRWSGYSLTLLLFVVFSMRQLLFAPVIIVLLASVPMTFFMLTHSEPSEEWTMYIGKAVLGPIYVGLPLAMLVLVDIRPNGKIWIFFLLTVIFANDMGAFYFGKFFGKHKLYEAVSPNKTWEGAIGGGLCSIIAALWFMYILGLPPIELKIFFLVLILSIMGQIGDLTASMLKRNHGVKDSGKILPGHGGMLDRIDGLLFAIPIQYLFLLFLKPTG
jgi:phosphatidate cytidylyltransferase